jgi:hypothetical protein
LWAAGKGGGVECLWCWDFLQLDAGGLEGGGFLGLCYSVGGYSCISPGDCSIAVFFGPVALGFVNFRS